MYFNFACHHDDYKAERILSTFRALRPLPSFILYKFKLSNADQLQFLFVIPLRCSTIMKSFILPVILTLYLSGVNSLSVWISKPQRPCFSYHIYSP